MAMTSPAVLLPQRWLGRGWSRSVSLAEVNQAVTGRRLFSQSAKTSSAVPRTGRSGKLRRPGPRRAPYRSRCRRSDGQPPTNARHRMGVWWVEVVGIVPTTGVGRIGRQVPRIVHRLPQQLLICQTTTSRGQALAGFAPQPLEQNHGVTGARLMIGIHRRDGKRARMSPEQAGLTSYGSRPCRVCVEPGLPSWPESLPQGLALTACSAEPGTASADNPVPLASWIATNVEAAPAQASANEH